MILLFIASVFIATGILYWLLQHWAIQQYARYQESFQYRAKQDLTELFLFLDTSQVWLASLGLAGISAILVYLFFQVLILAFLAALLGLVLPNSLLTRARKKRLQQLDQQLPDFLLSLSATLRAGTGLQMALRHSAAHTPAPLGQELALILREQRMGIGLLEALSSLLTRVPTEGISLLVSALSISAQSGGSLAETLEQIAATLRARLHLLGRIRALTAQGRMQAWVMAALPFLLAAALYWLNPDTMSLLWQTPAGWLVVAMVVLLELAGVFLIRRIVNIDV